MRSREILVVLALVLFPQSTTALSIPQSTTASSITLLELRSAGLQPVVQHHTKKGTIVCRDPQFKFSEQEWLSKQTEGLMREHMLVDLIVHKRLLHKQQSYVDTLFNGQRQDLQEIARYSVFAQSGRCGNVPKLVIEAVYDKQQNLIRYRTRYYEDGGSLASIDTKWIK
jgi:hypothetical protein